MTELRELGIYRLPDGREFIVCSSSAGDGYLLFTQQAWESGGYSQYQTRAEGKILSRGVPTKWDVEDLLDTGRTAE
jgi:hypothetical protein